MGLVFYRIWLWPWGVAIVAALSVLWALLAGASLGWLFAILAVAAGVAIAMRLPDASD